MNRNIIFNQIGTKLFKEINKVRVPATFTDMVKLMDGYPDEQITFTDDKKVAEQYEMLAERIKLYN